MTGTNKQIPEPGDRDREDVASCSGFPHSLLWPLSPDLQGYWWLLTVITSIQSTVINNHQPHFLTTLHKEIKIQDQSSDSVLFISPPRNKR